jgi:hypothetical protein
MPLQVNPAADLQALPLEFLISAPLTGAIKAQALAAMTTEQFLAGMKDQDGRLKTVTFKVSASDAMGPDRVTEISAPLLAMVPVPHLRIDSVTTQFKYEISQTVSAEKGVDMHASVDLATGAGLSFWASGTLRGSVAASSSNKEVANRSGMLEVTVRASEVEMPAGLARVLTAITSAIRVTPAATAQVVPGPLAPGAVAGG